VTLALLSGAAAAVLAFVVIGLVEERGLARGALAAIGVRGAAPVRRSLDLSRFGTRLSLGELPVRTLQGLAAATVLAFAVGLVSRSLGLILVATVFGVATGYGWTQRRRWTLAARVDRQIADAMTVMANALAAGGTVFQAVDAAAAETPAPLGELLRRTASRAELTSTVEAALRDLSASVGSRDIGNLVAALAIQRVAGGNLARLLRESAEFLKEEQRLRAEARALSAQARYSAQMIGVMPIALFLIFYAFFPSFVAPLTSTAIGLVILSYCLASTVLGFYVIWRIALRIENV